MSPEGHLTIRRWQIATAFAIVVIVFVGGLLWVQHVSSEAHAAAQQAKALARQVNHESLLRTGAIQRSRIQVCRDQNQRHDATIQTLSSLIAKVSNQAATASERRRILGSKAGQIALINALVPRRDCLHDLTGEKHKNP